jgi:hypothetical protein
MPASAPKADSSRIRRIRISELRELGCHRRIAPPSFLIVTSCALSFASRRFRSVSSSASFVFCRWSIYFSISSIAFLKLLDARLSHPFFESHFYSKMNQIRALYRGSSIESLQNLEIGAFRTTNQQRTSRSHAH